MIKAIINGPPGSGKTSASRKINKKYGVIIVSTGDLLRENLDHQTPLGKVIEKYIKEKTIIPDDTIIQMIIDRMNKLDCKEKGWILDGFPRTVFQAEQLRIRNIIPNIIINLEISKKIAEDRILNRRIDPINGEIYNVKTNIPIDNHKKDQLVKRTDDTLENFENRYLAYQNYGIKVNEYYKDVLINIKSEINIENLYNEIYEKLIYFTKKKEISNNNNNNIEKKDNLKINIEKNIIKNNQEEIKDNEINKKKLVTQFNHENSKEMILDKNKKDNKTMDIPCNQIDNINDTMDEKNKNILSKDTNICTLSDSTLIDSNKELNLDSLSLKGDDKKLNTFKEKIIKGIEIIKHGRRGNPHNRIIFCDENFTRIYWQKPGKKNIKFKLDQSIVLNDVEIERGISTEILQRSGTVSKNKKYISVIADDRSLDIETITEDECNFIYNGLQEIINNNNNNDNE